MPGTQYVSAGDGARHVHHHHHHTSGTRSPGRSSSPITKKSHKSSRTHRSTNRRHCRRCHRTDGTHSRSCSHTHHHHHHSHTAAGGGGGVHTLGGNSAKAAASSAPSLVILVLLGVASLVFIGVGIWLLANRFGWPVALDFVGSKDWTRFLSIGLLIFLAGLFMLIIVVLAFSIRVSGSRVARTALVFLLAVAFSFLLLISLLCIIFGAQGVGWTTNWLRDGWEKTARTTPGRLCDFQRRNRCYGFEDNDCAGCDVTSSGEYTSGCSEIQRQLCPPCVTGDGDGNDNGIFLLPAISLSSLIAQNPPPVLESARPSRPRTVAFVAPNGAPLTRLASIPGAVDAALRTTYDRDAAPTPEATDASGSSSGGAAAGGTTGGGTTGGGATGGGTTGTEGSGASNGVDDGTQGGIIASNGAGLFTDYTGNGCKDAIKTDFRQFMIPFAVAALFTLLLVFLLFFFFCCAVGKK